MRASEVVDRYTVLKLKFEHGQDCKEELDKFEEYILEFDDDFIKELYEVNKKLWPLHEDISELTNEEAGKQVKKLFKLSLQRKEIRGEIDGVYGDFRDTYSYESDRNNIL